MGSADHAASVTQALNRICRHVLSQMVLCQFCRLSVFGAVLSCAAAAVTVAVSAIFTIMITPDILGSALLPMMCCMCVSVITEIVEAVFLNG